MVIVVTKTNMGLSLVGKNATRQIYEVDVNYYLAEVNVSRPLVINNLSILNVSQSVLLPFVQELLKIAGEKVVNVEIPIDLVEIILDADGLDNNFNIKNVLRLVEVFGANLIADIIFKIYRDKSLFSQEGRILERNAISELVDKGIQDTFKNRNLKLFLEKKGQDQNLYMQYLPDLADFIKNWKSINIIDKES